MSSNAVAGGHYSKRSTRVWEKAMWRVSSTHGLRGEGIHARLAEIPRKRTNNPTAGAWVQIAAKPAAIPYHTNVPWSFAPIRVRLVQMTSRFLTQLADQLRKGRSAACGRSIQQILILVTARFEAGKYPSQVEAESEFRSLVNAAFLRIANNPPS